MGMSNLRSGRATVAIVALLVLMASTIVVLPVFAQESTPLADLPVLGQESEEATPEASPGASPSASPVAAGTYEISEFATGPLRSCRRDGG